MTARRSRHGILLAFLGFMALGGCDPATDPGIEGVPEEELQVLMFPDSLLPLVTKDTSFWAVRGRDTTFVLRYQPQSGEQEGEEFLAFRVRQDALLERPNGTAFAEGDSIEIHIAVDETGRFLFDFQPSGLKFDPDEPAELRVYYLGLDGDLDGDGDVDADDNDIEENLRIWRQEAPGDLWYPVGTIRLKDIDELRGEIEGFTGFAVAI